MAMDLCTKCGVAHRTGSAAEPPPASSTRTTEPPPRPWNDATDPFERAPGSRDYFCHGSADGDSPPGTPPGTFD